MKQHLKVRAKLSSDRTKVHVIAVEQTHFGGKFGSGTVPGTFRGIGEFVHNNVALRSATTCAFYPSYGPMRLYFSSLSGPPITIPIKYWEEIKEAIEAYNEWGETQ